VLAFTEQVVQNYARLLVAAGAEVICILEPTAVMLGPVQFEEFSAGYVKRVMRSYASTGVDTLYHVCGNSSHLVGAMAASGVTGLSLDSRETGIDLAEIARGTPGDVLIIGNVNPVTTMVQGRPQDVRREVRNLRLEMSRFPNYVLSTGCDLPQETPLDNIRAFMDEGRKRVGSCGDGCVDGSAKTAAAPVMC
jgi:uroporphyrinogen decarboxylase